MVERDRHSIVATFFSATPFAPGETVALSEAAAHHARVKRLQVGDAIRLTDGGGAIGIATLAAIEKGGADATISEVERVPREWAIHLRVPIGDRDRMLWLAEKSTELGVASWQAIRFRRSMSVSPRGEGASFAEKVRARMISALEQSGGAWLPEILPDADLAAITLPSSPARLLLDADGAPLLGDAQLSSSAEPVILFGPEGGLEVSEREALIQSAWHPVRLAQNILRFETAGIAAVAAVRAAQLLTRN
jgi:16S rRNA (uracil1498-N3)-methyltransferase